MALRKVRDVREVFGGITDTSREVRDVREVYRRDSCARTLAPFALRKLLALLVGQPDGFAAGELTRDRESCGATRDHENCDGDESR